MTSQKPNPQQNELTAISNAMADAVELASQAVVLVDARRRIPASGIVYAAGLVLTAGHVIEREDDITVMAPGGNEYPAQLTGRDPGSDLAVLRTDPSLAVLAAPAGAEARVGQLALALGRPSPSGIQASLGIITSKGGSLRTRRGGMLESYLTTDAIPYPGFSGGPLIDAAGNVLGVNTSGLARGASLAVPSGLAWQIAGALAEHGKVRYGYLGIRSQPVTLPGSAQKSLGREQSMGLVLVGIEENSPAADAGLMLGDIVTAIGGQPLNDPDELSSRLTGSMVGQQTQVEVLRGGQPVSIAVTVGERR